jgi:tetratricopeptide (TPR) repeat protein
MFSMLSGRWLRKCALGESLASVQKYDAPPENVTTPSLDALKAYSLGYKEAYVKTDYATAIPLFQRAASIDPNFAMAYARLGNSYYDLAETARAAEAARKAYELRERVSEREKLYIDSHYEQLVMGNLDAARKTYELWAQTYYAMICHRRISQASTLISEATIKHSLQAKKH